VIEGVERDKERKRERKKERKREREGRNEEKEERRERERGKVTVYSNSNHHKERYDVENAHIGVGHDEAIQNIRPRQKRGMRQGRRGKGDGRKKTRERGKRNRVFLSSSLLLVSFLFLCLCLFSSSFFCLPLQGIGETDLKE
jgi:hypothetical protein